MYSCLRCNRKISYVYLYEPNEIDKIDKIESSNCHIVKLSDVVQAKY